MKHSVHKLVNAPEERTIAGYLATHPKSSPKHAAQVLYPKPCVLVRLWRRWPIKKTLGEAFKREFDQEALDHSASLGNWGPRRPSDLFLKMYDSVCLCLERDPLAGAVSPPRLGQNGTMPLTILSVIPDILKHYYDVIVAAENEVLIATNYWQPSNSVNTISSALRELSRRAGERGGPKPVVKVIYDRGSIKQGLKNHLSVSPPEWKALDFPSVDEIPNIHLNVVNFHRPLLGTFHVKMIIVDRKLACVNSNNIQDRPNLEMMVHLEGAVVDSLYDTFLLSYHNKLDPPLPCINKPASKTFNPTFGEQNRYLANIEVLKAARAARTMLKDQSAPQMDELKTKRVGIADAFIKKALETRRRVSSYNDRTTVNNGDSVLESTEPHVPEVSEGEEIRRTSVTHPGRTSITHPGSSAQENIPQEDHDASASTLSGDKHIHEKHEGLDHDNSNFDANLPKVSGNDDFNESNEYEEKGYLDTVEEASRSSVKGRLRALSNALNAGALSKAYSNLPDGDESNHLDFTSHVFHAVHEPFPIALVNRKPHGMPGHQDIRVPQDAAWMAMFRYAEKKIFIQTPTFNAKRAVKGAINACRRGVEVILYLGLGFNDKGESIPFQGGTNEEVVRRMYRKLRKEKKEQYLRVYWYTGKDQIRPLNAVHKTRNCHVKFASADDQVAIMGNGNQDTQSWMHSAEVNIMIDSPEIVKEWHEAITTNQNTHIYGEVCKDGIWRDKEGKVWEDYDTRKLKGQKKKI